MAGSSLGRIGGEVIIKEELTAEPQRGIPVFVREVVWSESFVYFVNIFVIERQTRDGRMEGTRGIMCSHSTLSAPPYDWC